ncbi:MAG: DUF4363 family protein [Clostridia bacterium]|nr:DUF4363 family protein [Clostridia bacterium]
MKKKIINVLIIVLIITGLCVIEQVLAQQYFKELNIKASHIESIISTAENLSSNDIPYYTDDLSTYWHEKEIVLATFVNHKQIEDLGVEIDKLKTSIFNNNREQYVESLSLIKLYISNYEYLVGINLQNIF